MEEMKTVESEIKEEKTEVDISDKEISETKESNVDKENPKSKKSFGKRFFDWYVEHRKLVIGLLCTFTAGCFLTVKFGLTRGVLFLGELGRPEYADLYDNIRNEILNVDTNPVMTEFKVILAIGTIILFLCNLFAPARYESDKCPATCNWFINFALITLGFSNLVYGVLMISCFKLLSVTTIMYIFIGVCCFLLLPCANKDFDAEHPDRYEFKIGSYVCGVLGIILIVAVGFGNVRKDITAVKDEKERYENNYRSGIFTNNWDDTSENWIYVKLHFYNEYKQDVKDYDYDYDYDELKASYLNLIQNNGKSWDLWKKIEDNYIYAYLGKYGENADIDYDNALSDYSKLVAQQLYYEGYLDGNDFKQPMLGEEILANACQEVDKIFYTESGATEYKEDIEINIEKPLVVGENTSLEISYPENNGEYAAYIMKVGRVSHIGSENMLEKTNCLSQDEFIIKDNSVYLVKLMVMSDLNHTLGEDVKVSVKGLEYDEIDLDSWTYEYTTFSGMGERKEAVEISMWVATGDCDGSYKVIENLNLEAPQGFCVGDSIDDMSTLETIKTGNPNAIVTSLKWEADYPSSGHYNDTKISKEPKMYKMYATLLSETGYGFSENTEGNINGKKLPKGNGSISDFWSGGYVSLRNSGNIGCSVYYYRVTTESSYGYGKTSKKSDLVTNYDYAVAGTVVTLDPAPAAGYKLKTYKVEIELKNSEKYDKWKPVIENNSFVMPAAPIKITAVYVRE